MYESKSFSAEQFIKDDSIILPRFQRRLVWPERKNFGLALSLFKRYPLGVLFISVEHADDPVRMRKSLIDGRQRREALSKMLNPENIYEWASKSLGLKVRDTPTEIESKFWKYVDEFFGYEGISVEEAENSATDAVVGDSEERPEETSEDDDGAEGEPEENA